MKRHSFAETVAARYTESKRWVPRQLEAATERYGNVAGAAGAEAMPVSAEPNVTVRELTPR